MTGVFLVITAVYGLLFGSFINLCIHRIPLGQSIINPPSLCTNCDSRFEPQELIPLLGYMYSKGRCRHCGARISLRYPMIEILTSLVYVMLYLRFSLSVEFLAAVFLMTVLIIVFFIDIDYRIIPDSLVIAAMVGGTGMFAHNFFKPVSFYFDRNWWNPPAGIIAGSGMLFLVYLAGRLIYKTDEAIGMGDVKIFAPIGLFLGWRLTLVALFLSFMMAALTSFVLVVLKIKDRRDTIPFGPFIVAATFASLMWGEAILAGYLNP